DGRHHAVGRIGDEMTGADRAHLPHAHCPVGVDLHQHRLAEPLLRRPGVVAAAGKDAVHPHRQLGYEDFDAFDLHGLTSCLRRRLLQFARSCSAFTILPHLAFSDLRNAPYSAALLPTISMPSVLACSFTSGAASAATSSLFSR